MDHPVAPVFESDVHLAEVATAGVRFNLGVSHDMTASALQPVARAAWGLVQDPADPAPLRRAARRAITELRLVCGASAERRFLQDVLDHLERRAGSANRPEAVP